MLGAGLQGKRNNQTQLGSSIDLRNRILLKLITYGTCLEKYDNVFFQYLVYLHNIQTWPTSYLQSDKLSVRLYGTHNLNIRSQNINSIESNKTQHLDICPV